MYENVDDFVPIEFQLTEGMLIVPIIKSFEHYFVQYIPRRLIFVLQKKKNSIVML